MSGNLCQQTNECKAFSWISKTFSDASIHNKCHLKTQDGPITAMTGVVTGSKGCPVPLTKESKQPRRRKTKEGKVTTR